MKHRLLLGLCALGVSLSLSGCKSTPQAEGGRGSNDAAARRAMADDSPRKGSDATASASQDAAASGVLTAPVPALSGPKRTVAVGKFDSIGAFKAIYGDMDIGGGLGAMMTTALIESDRFIVLERANVNQVLAEQELKSAGLTTGEAAPDTGGLVGVQLMMYGSVTEFGLDESGGGFSVGVGGLGGRRSGVGVGASPQWTKGKVTMDIRVVDTTTGEVVENFRVSRKVESSAIDLGLSVRQIQVGHNSFTKTPLGQAAREAITEAVQKFAQIAQNRPWSGRVVEMEGEDVIINAGSDAGIRPDQIFKVARISRKLTDPATGKVLGQRQSQLGKLRVKSVEPKLAIAEYLPLSGEKPQRGDLVLLP